MEPNDEHDDIHLMQTLLRHHPDLNDIYQVARLLKSRAQFPLNSAADVEEALGGHAATFEFAGQAIPVTEIRNMVPAYYFPIATEDDLVAKIADLRARHPGLPGMGRGPIADISLPARDDQRPPDVPSSIYETFISELGDLQMGVLRVPE